MSVMLRVWNTNTTLIAAAYQFKEQVNQLVRTTLEDAKVEKDLALESLRTDCEVCWPVASIMMLKIIHI
jgi:hypothetical protein